MSQKSRKYKCAVCAASFYRSTHLARHEQSHTQAKPYICPKCHHPFGRLDVLIRHERSLHGTNSSSGIYGKTARSQRNHSITPLPQPPQPAPYKNPNIPSPNTQNIEQSPENPSQSLSSENSPQLHESTSHTLDHAHQNIDPSLDSVPNIFQNLDAESSSHHSPIPLFDFDWTNFGHFDDINQSLDILNRNDDVNAQLDQLMNMNYLSNLDSTLASPANAPGTPVDGEPGSALCPPNRILRIPTSDDIPIRGIHSGPPPTTYVWKRLREHIWQEMNNEINNLGHKLDGFRLPQASVINLYTSAYMSGINQHLPFLHLPTLDLNEMSLPLLLSICSIGALYCFEKEQAKKLHEAASKLLAEVLDEEAYCDDSPTHVIQTILLCLLFAAWTGDSVLLKKRMGLHAILGDTLRTKARYMSRSQPVHPSQWHEWVKEEEFRRTYFVAFCGLVQIQLLYDIPTSLSCADITSLLPTSEEQWTSKTPSETLSTKPIATPTFRSAFLQLFNSPPSEQIYSEFGGYIMINAILATILESNRNRGLYSGLLNEAEGWLDNALDNWQRLWHVDPKSHSSGPSSAFGAMAFNASAVYRAACIRRVRDYSRIKEMFKLGNQQGCVQEVLDTLNEDIISRRGEMIRAIVPACISFQIPVKLGVKLVAQTAALFWSLDHVFCNFEAALFILQWLYALEQVGTESITEEEIKVFRLLSNLLVEADPEQNVDERPMSQRFMSVKAYQYSGVIVWGVAHPLSRLCETIAQKLAERGHQVPGQDMQQMDIVGSV